MPRLDNICTPKNIYELSECLKWKYDLIMHDKDRFSIPLGCIKGITIPDPTKRYYKVYYYSKISEDLAAFYLKLTDDIILPKICPQCDQKLAQIFMDTLTYSCGDIFTDCTPICCSPEFNIDGNNEMFYIVFINQNGDIDYSYEYKDNMPNDLFILLNECDNHATP